MIDAIYDPAGDDQSEEIDSEYMTLTEIQEDIRDRIMHNHFFAETPKDTIEMLVELADDYQDGLNLLFDRKISELSEGLECQDIDCCQTQPK